MITIQLGWGVLSNRITKSGPLIQMIRSLFAKEEGPTAFLSPAGGARAALWGHVAGALGGPGGGPERGWPAAQRPAGGLGPIAAGPAGGVGLGCAETQC